jgi:signal transduction histidine kinase
VLDRDPHSGLPRRAIGIVRDVSARHRLEAELRHGQKLQALGELAGGIAHDFNNVLQAVGCGAALIEEFPDNAEAVRRRARMLAGVVERGASITHRLLSLARRGDLHTDAVDPDDLLQGLRAILIPSLTACIEVRVEPTAALPPLLADRAQLETALINLATNARDAMPDGGTLSFSAAEERVEAGDAPARLAAGRYVRLCVRDTGMGIPPAMLARVQEPFFTTKPDGAGTGLGLSMVKDFAERSGGGFAIASVPGEGTMVTLWFPQVMEAIVGEAAAGEAVAGEAAGRAGT